MSGRDLDTIMNLLDDEDDSYGGPDAYVEGDDGPEDIEFEVEEDEDGEDEDDGDDDEEDGGHTEADVSALLNGKVSAFMQLFPADGSHTALINMQEAERRQHIGLAALANATQSPISLDSSLVARVQQLLGARVAIATNDEDDADDDEDGYFNHYGHSGKWDRSEDWYYPVTKPTKEGLKLLMSGEFGRLTHQLKSRKLDNNIAKVTLDRGTRIRPSFKEDMAAVRYI